MAGIYEPVHIQTSYMKYLLCHHEKKRNLNDRMTNLKTI
jgi:hypothetical protein